MQPSLLAFGVFSFDERTSVLFREGAPVALGRRSASLLRALLQRRGTVVAKSDLMDAAWPGTVVEESNLSVQIAQLRRRLGRRPDSGEWIATVARVGYRFQPEASPQPIASVVRSEPPSIAVLPFDDLGPRPDNHRSSDGFVEDLTTALSQFKSIAVAARSSSFQYGQPARDIRRVAQSLGVRYILEGSTQRNGLGIRTTAQLIDGATGAHVWAQHFDTLDGRGDQSVAITDVLAASLEAQIHEAEIARARRDAPDQAEAYAYYLKGRQTIRSSRQDGNASGYGFFLKALEIEPDNAEYLAGVSEAFHHRTSVGWDPLTGNDLLLAREYVRRGLDVVGNDAVSLGLFACALATIREEDLALATARRAVEMNRNSPLVLVNLGLMNIWAGDLDEAEASYKRAFHLSHNNPVQRFSLGGLAKIAVIRGNHEDAVTWATRALAVNPWLSAAHQNLIAAAAHLGRMDDARRYLERYRAISPEVTVSRLERGQPGHRSRLKTMLAGLERAGLPVR